jgi:ABC-2 type transport system permease protein
MSTPALSSSPPPEAAPSQLAADEPAWARTLGLVGMMLAVLGLTVVTFNAIYGPRIIGPGTGYLCVAIGVIAMLFHAIRDSDLQIRRAYGNMGFALILAAGLFAAIKPTSFLAYGWASLLAALCFLLCCARHETEPGWRKRLLVALGGVGALLAVGGILGGIVVEGFMLTYGSLMAIIGLAYLVGFLTQADPAGETAHRAGLAIGAGAVFVILYALLRSMIPAALKMDVAPFFVPTGLLLLVLGVLYGGVALGAASESRLVVLARRELMSYFTSPIAYIVMLGMALLAAVAYFFFVDLIKVGMIRVEPIVLFYFQDLPPYVVIFVVPAITMRLLAEEKRTGTYEVLLCAPVKETTVVLAKHIAALIFFMLLWGIWALYLVALRAEAGKEFDYRPMLSFFLALAVCGSSFIAMGLFFSSLSKNQIVGAVLTFLGLLTLTILGASIVQRRESIGSLWKAVFQNLSYSELWLSSLKGRLQVRALILQGSFTFFWLFLTVKVLEARRWS